MRSLLYLAIVSSSAVVLLAPNATAQNSATCDRFFSAVGYPSRYQAQQNFDFLATPEEQAILDIDGDGFACDGLSYYAENYGVDRFGTLGGENGYWGADGYLHYY